MRGMEPVDTDNVLLGPGEMVQGGAAIGAQTCHHDVKRLSHIDLYVVKIADVLDKFRNEGYIESR